MTYTLDGNMGTTEIVCGFEEHAKGTSEANLFSGASAAVSSGQVLNTPWEEGTILDAGPALERVAGLATMP